jgi:hypothetical protein
LWRILDPLDNDSIVERSAIHLETPNVYVSEWLT